MFLLQKILWLEDKSTTQQLLMNMKKLRITTIEVQGYILGRTCVKFGNLRVTLFAPPGFIELEYTLALANTTRPTSSPDCNTSRLALH